MAKPALPIVLGTGPFADAVRAEIDRDPDCYRPMTCSINPVGQCPCCDRAIYQVKSKLTDFEYGYAPGIEDDTVLHQQPGLDGTPEARCCYIAPNWSPKHKAKPKPKRKAKPRRRQ